MSNDSPPREYKYKLNADDFVKLFLATNEEFEELKKQLLGNAENGIGRKNGYTSLIDVEIEGDIIIKDEISNNCSHINCIDVKMKAFTIRHSNLRFGNGLKETYIEFNDSEIESITITANSAIGDVFFTRCEIGLIEIYSSSIEWCSITESKTGNIRISSTSKTKDFHILKSITGNFVIDDSTTGKFDFDNASIIDFDLTNSQSEDITFNSCGTGKINIQKSILESISLDTCSTGDFDFANAKIGSFRTSFQNCSFNISKSIINDFNVSNCNIPKFRISPNCLIEAYISGGQINEADFRNTTLSKESLISFSKTFIYSLQMEEFSMLGNLYFRQISKAKKEFEWTDIDEFIKILESKEPIPSKTIDQLKQQHDKRETEYKKNCELLKKFVKEPTIRISQSSLGKTEFTDCPLGEFRFEFNNSKIIECFVSGGSIPTENVHIIGVEPNTLKENEQKASFFNQFKKMFEAQGDIYRATQFQAKWAEEQRKLLELIHKGEKGWFNTTFSDLWILKLNKWSNLHGESWPRAFGWIMGLGLAFYLLYLFSIGRLVTTNEFDFNLIGYYFEFLNPTHKFNFINEGNIVSGWTVFIDVAWRIIVAYLIYQFIAAFRKHSKKQ